MTHSKIILKIITVIVIAIVDVATENVIQKMAQSMTSTF